MGKLTLEKMLDKEQRLFHLMDDKKKDIQLYSVNEFDSQVVINDTTLTQFNLYLGIVTKDGKSCVGRFGTNNFSYPSDQPSGTTRVWIDRRREDPSFYINSGDHQYELSDDEEHADVLFIGLLYCPKFVYFFLYDGALPHQKATNIFTMTSNPLYEKLLTVAYSMFNQQFPGLFDYLLQLEGDKHED